MAKQQTNSPFNQDEFQRIFDEYRSKIEEITRSTGRTLEALRIPSMEPSEEHAPAEAPDERADSEEPDKPAPARPEAARPPAQPARLVLPERPARPVSRDDLESHLPESERVIRAARKEAQRILEEAEKQARKEARKKTKAQADKILAKARQSAEEYAEKARQAVEQERAAALESSRTQAEQSMKEMTEHFRQQAHAKSTQLVEEAKARADRLMAEVTQASTDISHKVNDVVERSRATINEFEERLRNETDDISQAIVDTQSRIEALALAAAEEAARTAEPEPSAASAVPANVPTMVVKVLGERSNGRGGTQPLFFGMVEISAPPETCDFKYFKAMKRYLISIPGIKQLQESASEKALSALFDVTEPLPLIDLLAKVPLVDQVISRGDRDISLVFKG
jgi:gas vesicle protein